MGDRTHPFPELATDGLHQGCCSGCLWLEIIIEDQGCPSPNLEHLRTDRIPPLLNLSVVSEFLSFLSAIHFEKNNQGPIWENTDGSKHKFMSPFLQGMHSITLPLASQPKKAIVNTSKVQVLTPLCPGMSSWLLLFSLCSPHRLNTFIVKSTTVYESWSKAPESLHYRSTCIQRARSEAAPL